jgi:hypothetical protein
MSKSDSNKEFLSGLKGLAGVTLLAAVSAFSGGCAGDYMGTGGQGRHGATLGEIMGHPDANPWTPAPLLAAEDAFRALPPGRYVGRNGAVYIKAEDGSVYVQVPRR